MIDLAVKQDPDEAELIGRQAGWFLRGRILRFHDAPWVLAPSSQRCVRTAGTCKSMPETGEKKPTDNGWFLEF